jgi:hypothetical protein
MNQVLVSVFLRYFRRVGGAGAAVTAALALVVGCSAGGSGGSHATGPTCDSSKCGPGNQCVDDGSGSGPQCHLVCTQHSQCPSGWYCNDGTVPAASGGPGQPANWCIQGTASYPTVPGQFGTPCLPSEGEGNNKACDTADAFACYGQTPTDANAFCTQFNCSADSDCPGGWWCETVDKAPNVLTNKRSFGQTRTVCRPRQYCATCQEDHDCPKAANGTQQHCVQDSQGNGFCSLQCTADANCPLDATCVTAYPVCLPAQGATCASDEDCPPTSSTFQHCYGGTCTPECGSDSDCTGTSQKCGSLGACQPRAGVCVGSGSFCDPCRSDADCSQAGGTCMRADYSTERYCSVPTKGTCPTTTQQGVIINQPGNGMCPTAPSGSPASSTTLGAVGCTFSSTDYAPPNQCVALTSISDGSGGETQVLGCWTVNR